jgi:hypothetical protein
MTRCSRAVHTARRYFERGGEVDNGEMQIKTTSGESSVSMSQTSLSPADLVDQIQRDALRDRFQRAEIRHYPSPESVRRAIAEFDRSHWVSIRLTRRVTRP